MTFEDLGLPDFLLQKIKELNWNVPTPIQTLVIPKALEGHDILGGAPTGTGKSAAFLLPIISHLASHDKPGIRAVVLEPTRELALQMQNVALKLVEDVDDISVGTIIGGGDRELQRDQLCSIVTATPGRLTEFLKKGWIDASSVELYVIDEADRMLDMGFRDDVLAITERFSLRSQTMLFSATLEGFGVQDFAKQVLDNPIEIRIGAGSMLEEKLPNLLQSRAYYAAGDPQKFKILLHLLTTVKVRSIVFVNSKERLKKVEAILRRQGLAFASLQGDASMAERKAALRRFSQGEAEILVATDVASRGLDLPEVNCVYNFDLPSNAAIYVHRAGRTARAGAKGVVASLVLADEIGILSRIERYTQKDIERRSIKGLCAAFPSGDNEPRASEKKRSRASAGGNGGFDKKTVEEKKTHKKNRYRVTKNKGKPDFAAKRAKKAARSQAISNP